MGDRLGTFLLCTAGAVVVLLGFVLVGLAVERVTRARRRGRHRAPGAVRYRPPVVRHALDPAAGPGTTGVRRYRRAADGAVSVLPRQRVPPASDARL